MQKGVGGRDAYPTIVALFRVSLSFPKHKEKKKHKNYKSFFVPRATISHGRVSRKDMEASYQTKDNYIERG